MTETVSTKWGRLNSAVSAATLPASTAMLRPSTSATVLRPGGRARPTLDMHLLSSPDLMKTAPLSTKALKEQRRNAERRLRQTPSRPGTAAQRPATSSLIRPSTAGVQLTRVPSLILYLTHSSPIDGLSELQLRSIYKAKCDDLNIPVLAIQEKRFFEYCTKFLSNRHFNLSESGIGPVAGKVIADAVRNNPSFCKLTLSRNILGDTGAIIVVRTLARALNLIHLDLSSNSISPSGAVDVIKVVMTHGGIVSFDISSHEGLHRNRLGMQGAAAVVSLLKRNSLLWVLNVAGTSLGNEGVETLGEGLVNNSSLLSLNVANNNLVGKGIENFLRAVAFTKLTSLNLSANKLGNAGCETVSALLFGTFGAMCPLHFLDLSKNEIGHSGASKIFNAMSRNATLETLLMSDNPISGQYNIALCHFISDNLSVKLLDLTNCDLRSNGASTIGEGLGKNHGIKTLLLSNNLLEDSEMESFGRGIEKNSALKSLDISNNKISDKGGLLICAGLRRNDVIERINVRDNEFHDVVGQVFAEISRKQHNIVRLLLENNPISYKYVNEIKANLIRNERFRSRQQAPKLQRELRELELMDYDVSRIDRDIEYMLGEQRKAEDQYDKQLEKKQQMKEQEEAKTHMIMQELQKIKQVKIDKGLEYQGVLGEMGSERVKFDREYRELEDHLTTIAAEAHKAGKDCNCLCSNDAEKRICGKKSAKYTAGREVE